MSTLFNRKIEQYKFDKDGILQIKNSSQHGEDWPVVYILNEIKKHMLAKHKVLMIE